MVRPASPLCGSSPLGNLVRPACRASIDQFPGNGTKKALAVLCALFVAVAFSGVALAADNAAKAAPAEKAAPAAEKKAEPKAEEKAAPAAEKK